MGNVTRTPLNETANSTNSGGSGGKAAQKVSDPVPPFRPGQDFTVITVQFAFCLAIIVGALTINIIMGVVLHRKLKTIPYVMLLNIVAVDIATAFVNGPFFGLGIILDQLGIILKSYCNVQGFFHASFSAVFLNTVSLIAISRILAVLQPDLYHKIFVNKIVMRFLLLAVWSTSALLCVPPLNYKGWGAYKRFETTCWLAWIPDNKDYMAYNSLITILSFGTALASCILGLYVFYSARKVAPVVPRQAVPPPPYPGTMEMTGVEKTAHIKVHVNTDVFIIAAIQFLTYIILWVPLTIMNSIYLKDWRDIEFRAITFFLFMFIGRTISNPLVCLLVSETIRNELVSTIFRCRCTKRQNETNQLEL